MLLHDASSAAINSGEAKRFPAPVAQFCKQGILPVIMDILLAKYL